MSKLSLELITYYSKLPALIISVLGCLFVIVLFIIAKPLRIYAFKLVFWLTFFDLIKFLCLIFPVFELNYNQDSICRVICLVYFFSVYCTLLWTLAIAITLYQCLILEKEGVERFYKYWLAISLVFAAVCSTIPLSTQSYGYEFSTCELKDDLHGVIYKFACFYIPVLIENIVITYIYVKIYRKYSFKNSSFKRDLSVTRLLAYPIIMAVCTIPVIIVDTLSIWNIENYYAIICAYMIWCLHGFFNAIAYAITPPVIFYIKFVICKRNQGSIDEISMFESFSSLNANHS